MVLLFTFTFTFTYTYTFTFTFTFTFTSTFAFAFASAFPKGSTTLPRSNRWSAMTFTSTSRARATPFTKCCTISVSTR